MSKTKTRKLKSSKILSTIDDIYTQFPVPVNLSMHMKRVAGVAEMLLAHRKKPFSREVNDDILAAALLHDLGNIVKFDFSNTELYGNDIASEVDYWKGVQDEARDKYGVNSGIASLDWAAQAGASDGVLHLISQMGPVADGRSSDRYDEVSLLVYSDLRVAPNRVVSLSDRFDDLRSRYVGKVDCDTLENRFHVAQFLEREVCRKTMLSHRDISEKSVFPYVAWYII